MDSLIRGVGTFSKIDLQFDYHQICIRKEDIPKMAFCTRYGHYEYVVILFGLTSAPSPFMDLMDRVFKPYLDKFIIIFIDDIFIYSRILEERAYHLRKVLEVFRKHELCENEKV